MAATAVYLRPLAVLRGDAAAAALDGGWALPLGGREAAFAAAELWLRADGQIERSTLGVRDLAGWARPRGASCNVSSTESKSRSASPASASSAQSRAAAISVGAGRCFSRSQRARCSSQASRYLSCRR
jgi:hypothetical protein